MSAPTTPVVESLDNMEEKQISKLYKAIEDSDVPLVCKIKLKILQIIPYLASSTYL